MKRIIRTGVFETNSSSVHSLSITTQEIYANWVDENTIRSDGEFISRDEAINNIIEQLKEDEENFTTLEKYLEDNYLDINDLFREFDYVTYDNFGGENYEVFEKEFITPSGDKMVAFGYYGENR